MLAVTLIILPAILSSPLDLTSQDGNHRHLINLQLHEANLHVAQLESSLEKLNRESNDRDNYVLICENRIEEMEKSEKDLQSILSDLKDELLPVEKKIIALEEEVRVLWATLRKNNFDFHVLESKVREAEDRLEKLTSRVLKSEEVVTEQWIQIQQFEQALLLGEMRRLKAQRKLRSQRCTFLKVLNGLSDEYLPKAHEFFSSHSFGKESTISFYVSQVLHQLKELYSLVKKFHHELQGFIMEGMHRHDFTARLANEELVFFVTYSREERDCAGPACEISNCELSSISDLSPERSKFLNQNRAHIQGYARPAKTNIANSWIHRQPYPHYQIKEEWGEIEKSMEETTWEQRLQVVTHILTSPTTTPSLYSQFWVSAQIPCYLNWEYPPVLCCSEDANKFPSVYLRWGISLFLKRVSRFGLPETSWRCKCPYQVPPPLILAKGVEEARWGKEDRRVYLRKRVMRKKLLNDINPLIPILVPLVPILFPHLFALSLLFWHPIPDVNDTT